MRKITPSFISPYILITLLVLITFSFVENNPYANYYNPLIIQNYYAMCNNQNRGINNNNTLSVYKCVIYKKTCFQNNHSLFDFILFMLFEYQKINNNTAHILHRVSKIF